MMRNGWAALAACALSLAAGETQAAKKYIFSSWGIGESTPAQILRCADMFDKTGGDGVALNLGVSVPGYRRFYVSGLIPLDYARVVTLADTLRDIAKHPSLKESMLYVNTAPTNRLAWKDDRAWASFASNMGVAARLAKAGNFKGLVTDFEDYWRQNQYDFLSARDGDYHAAWKLARKRGAQVFGAVFDAFPEAVILSFQLLASEAEYGRSDDPRAVMLEKEDLFPAFVNGILDVLPPEARIVDGCEGLGYHGEASRGDFYRTAKAQLIGALPLVAKENRDKYRAQLSVSFGMYMDAYIVPEGNPYYFGPVRGKRINHFEDNLRQATECCDEYIWFWGENGFFVDWPKNIRNWEKTKVWNETYDGDFDQMCRGIKDPIALVREEFARRTADGTLKNLVDSVPKAGEKGGIHYRTNRVETDGWYGVCVKGRGKALWGKNYFQCGGDWRYELGAFRMTFGKPDADGWRDGTALVRIPDGATEIYTIVNGTHGKELAEIECKDLTVFRIR